MDLCILLFFPRSLLLITPFTYQFKFWVGSAGVLGSVWFNELGPEVYNVGFIHSYLFILVASNTNYAHYYIGVSTMGAGVVR